MNIFAKLFDVNGHQVLVRKTSVENANSECLPTVMFEMQLEHVDVANSFTYKTDELRDKAFNEVFTEKQVTETALKILSVCGMDMT